MQFDWDLANEEHVARHRISKAEVEESLKDPFSQMVDSDEVDGELRFRQIGATISGRLLTVAYTMRDEVVRPITAFDSSAYASLMYRQGARHDS